MQAVYFEVGKQKYDEKTNVCQPQQVKLKKVRTIVEKKARKPAGCFDQLLLFVVL